MYEISTLRGSTSNVLLLWKYTISRELNRKADLDVILKKDDHILQKVSVHLRDVHHVMRYTQKPSLDYASSACLLHNRPFVL